MPKYSDLFVGAVLLDVSTATDPAALAEFERRLMLAFQGQHTRSYDLFTGRRIHHGPNGAPYESEHITIGASVPKTTTLRGDRHQSVHGLIYGDMPAPEGLTTDPFTEFLGRRLVLDARQRVAHQRGSYAAGISELLQPFRAPAADCDWTALLVSLGHHSIVELLGKPYIEIVTFDHSVWLVLSCVPGATNALLGPQIKELAEDDPHYLRFHAMTVTPVPMGEGDRPYLGFLLRPMLFGRVREVLTAHEFRVHEATRDLYAAVQRQMLLGDAE